MLRNCLLGVSSAISREIFKRTRNTQLTKSLISWGGSHADQAEKAAYITTFCAMCMFQVPPTRS